ncbi:TetR/AcrR family transcriptional regulator [Chitinophaga sp. Cy-1792]|uniref:TetR/AcrR family transcriptional regulator n=1 Tax=Chitinophaga sp. Cy-1792 TaxID=2608339 RepID=UPI00141D8CC8|nr:TetR/AcrR family transcriptional regulator [Chitinophaga sp. Cy-1792]NIG55127.1 TetR/AcrR family transcriptional regulator [Chitinophaga sp. Cy-1792]
MRPRNLDKEQAIKSIALDIITNEGLENLTMQKLANAVGISPRTIYIKYADKEDLLVKLFVDEVLGDYEQAVLKDFSATMDFADGIRKLWQNTFHYLKDHQPGFALLQYSKTTPLLHKAYQERNIRQGDHFQAIHTFFQRHAAAGLIPVLPMDVYRALLQAPLQELVREYFDHSTRKQQIITDQVVADCCEMVIKGLLK